MDSTTKLRKQLSFEIAKLNGLQKSVDLTVDDPNTKALATEIREQAGRCLGLLDQYQLSMPGRMRSYSERGCQALRDDLRQTEMELRDASGIFQRRIEKRPHRDPISDWQWGDIYAAEPVLDAGPLSLDEQEISRSPDVVALSFAYIEAQNRQDLEGLIALIADDVEFKLAFDRPLSGKEAVRRQYEDDWADHESAFVSINEVFEAEGKVAIEVHVDCGPPSKVRFNGVVVHHWNDEGLLARYQLYVDEVPSAEEGP
jgi:ketosteroid isomerase-like protein